LWLTSDCAAATAKNGTQSRELTVIEAASLFNRRSRITDYPPSIAALLNAHRVVGETCRYSGVLGGNQISRREFPGCGAKVQLDRRHAGWHD
jgi:hypothetical protein